MLRLGALHIPPDESAPVPPRPHLNSFFFDSRREGETDFAGELADDTLRPGEYTYTRVAQRLAGIAAHDEDAARHEPPVHDPQRAENVDCAAEVDAAECQDDVYG